METPSDTVEIKMEEYDAIPHYLKLVANFNSTADINNENSSSTLQVNNSNINNRPIHSVSSGNLARSSSFKSFKNIQQSHKRCHTNWHTDNMDKILGTYCY